MNPRCEARSGCCSSGKPRGSRRAGAARSWWWTRSRRPRDGRNRSSICGTKTPGRNARSRSCCSDRHRCSSSRAFRKASRPDADGDRGEERSSRFGIAGCGCLYGGVRARPKPPRGKRWPVARATPVDPGRADCPRVTLMILFFREGARERPKRRLTGAGGTRSRACGPGCCRALLRARLLRRSAGGRESRESAIPLPKFRGVGPPGRAAHPGAIDRRQRGAEGFLHRRAGTRCSASSEQHHRLVCESVSRVTDRRFSPNSESAQRS